MKLKQLSEAQHHGRDPNKQMIRLWSEAVESLTQYMMLVNMEMFQQMIQDDPNDRMDFSKFGVDEETIEQYFRDLTWEVSRNLKERQKNVNI